jgi:Domain of unknown function (DUF4126)
VLEVLTGSGLAASAGLNAYIPLLVMGLLARYTDLIELPSGWQWLSNGWVVTILVVLLAVEFVADKVPVLDSVNDTLQTLVRPTAGGLAFGAGSASETVTVQDPGSFFTGPLVDWGGGWGVPIVAGVVLAFGVHALKAAARPVINAMTAGIGAPVVSTVEDVTSVSVSVLAIVVPLLVLFVLVGMIAFIPWLVVRLRRRRRQRRAQLAAARAGYPV